MLRLLSVVCFMMDVCARELSIADYGAVEGKGGSSLANTAAINHAFGNASAGDTVTVPAGRWLATGGIVHDSTPISIQIVGTLLSDPDLNKWPLDGSQYLNFITVNNVKDLTINGGGTVDGQGKSWWNKWILDPPKHERPKLLQVNGCTDVVIENFTMRNSPSFHLQITDALRARVGFITIEVDRDSQRVIKALKASQNGRRSGFGVEPEDLNTDGIDLSGRDIHIRDCKINNDDDSITVKPCGGSCPNSADNSKELPQCSRNMMIENTILTGFGASIGSVSPHSWPNVNCVSNITYRNISMPQTGKGIYVKSNPGCTSSANVSGLIEDISFIDIDISYPEWWPIWIGPQQQHEPGSSLGEHCSLDYPVPGSHCPTQPCVSFKNIKLVNVEIKEPWLSPGVMLGNASNPMEISFENVRVTKWKTGIIPPVPFGKAYKCKNVKLTTIGIVDPMPEC